MLANTIQFQADNTRRTKRSDFQPGVPQELPELMGYVTGTRLDTSASLLLVYYVIIKENGMEKLWCHESAFLSKTCTFA